MDATKLATIISLLVALSVAAERLVEIVKSLSPWLNVAKTDERAEGRRRAALQALAVIGGIVAAYLSKPMIPAELLPAANQGLTLLALGLLASGGSGFWNAMLSWVLEVKNIKKVEAKTAQSVAEVAETAGLRPQLAPMGGGR